MQPYGMPPPKQSNALAIASIVLATAPIAIGLFIVFSLLLFSVGDFLGDVTQGFWPLALLVFVGVLVIGIIADVLAVIFGIIAIVKRKALISWIGIIIVAAKALVFAMIL